MDLWIGFDCLVESLHPSKAVALRKRARNEGYFSFVAAAFFDRADHGFSGDLSKPVIVFADERDIETFRALGYVVDKSNHRDPGLLCPCQCRDDRFFRSRHDSQKVKLARNGIVDLLHLQRGIV